MITIVKAGFYRLEDRWRDETPPEVPKDMLRYDLAFHRPASADPLLIAIPTLKIRGRGVVKGKMTEARWASFGVILRPVTPSEYEMLNRSWEKEAEAWVTYRHPRDLHKGTDYSTLAPITLAKILAARDLDEV